MNGVWNSNWHSLLPFLFHLDNFTKMCFDQTGNLSQHKAWQISDKHIENLFFYLGSRFHLPHFISNCLHLDIWSFCSFLLVARWLALRWGFSHVGTTQLNGTKWIWSNILQQKTSESLCKSSVAWSPSQCAGTIFNITDWQGWSLHRMNKGIHRLSWIKIRHAAENGYFFKIIGYSCQGKRIGFCKHFIRQKSLKLTWANLQKLNAAFLFKQNS